MDTFRERFAHKLPSDYKRELLNVIGDKDMVVVYVRQTWTGADGQHHQALGFDMFRVQDGMITEHLGRGLKKEDELRRLKFSIRCQLAAHARYS